MMAVSVLAGTCGGVQLVALFQSLDTAPVHVIEAAELLARGRAHTSSSESIEAARAARSPVPPAPGGEVKLEPSI